MTRKFTSIVNIHVISLGLLSLFLMGSCSLIPSTTDKLPTQEIEPLIVQKYGYDVSEFFFEQRPVKRNEFMGDILMSYGVDFDKILELEKKAEAVFSLRKIRAGKNLTFIKKDECADPIAFVYQPSEISFVDFSFDESISVDKKEIPHERCIEQASGVVISSLWNAMIEQGFDVSLIDKMEDAVAQVNFHSAQPGDQFKLVYERLYVEGEPKSSGKIYSAAYKSGESEHHGFFFSNDKYEGYYDYDGVPNKKTFLNAPLRFSRISSGYNPNRFHPVLKRRKAHLGTDYAAPTGTPIYAVADGVVTQRSYTKGNGNYIKIRHNKTYQTQYLHMSRFAKSVKRGTAVKQGQTIGYVGQTGLATGPHVCFRFWKNGRQIDHRRENFPPLNPMDKDELPTYFEARDILLAELEAVAYKNPEVVYATLGKSK